MQCPTDGTTLTMSERSGIEIDYCPTCRGVWLDRGELDKIIERAVTQEPAQQQPQQIRSAPPPREHYRDDDDHRGYDKHRKYGHRRKSWLEEIFD